MASQYKSIILVKVAETLTVDPVTEVRSTEREGTVDLCPKGFNSGRGTPEKRGASVDDCVVVRHVRKVHLLAVDSHPYH